MDRNLEGERDVTHKVLVVCRDKDCQDSLSKMMSDEVFDIHFLLGKEDMLLEIMERDYDLIVYGLEADDYSDLKIIKILKKVRPKVPVIVISSESSSELGAKILQEGVVYFAVKPYNPEAVKSVIYNTLVN